MIATAGVGATVGAAKFFEGRKQQKEADKAIDSFEWQDLSNPFETLQVSTLGAENAVEQANIEAATATEALRGSGTRGIVAGLGAVEANKARVNREVGANLDTQRKEIDKMAAMQKVKNQEVIEGRQEDELAGYGAQLAAGQATKFAGLTDFTNGLGALGQAVSQSGKTTNEDTGQATQTQQVNSLQSVGAKPWGGTPLPSAPTPFR